MVFHSCISGTYHKSVRVAAGSTDLGSVMSVFKLLLRLSYWLLLNWGGGGGIKDILPMYPSLLENLWILNFHWK